MEYFIKGEKEIMKIYVVVEMLLGGKVPKIRGVYIDRAKSVIGLHLYQNKI